MSVKLTLDVSELSQLGWEGMVGQGMLEQLQSWDGWLGVSLLKFKFVWLLNSAPKCALVLVASAICLNLCDSSSNSPLFNAVSKKLMSVCLKVTCPKFLGFRMKIQGSLVVAVCLMGPSLESASYLALVLIFSWCLGELVQLTNLSAGQGGKLLIFLSKLIHFSIWRLENHIISISDLE